MLNLVSDSSCDLISGELNSPYARLTVAPMCLHVGGQDYLDTPELDIPALLSKLAHHRSSSACPSPAAYAEAFEQGEETVCFPAPITPPWPREIWFWRSTRKKRSLCWIPVPPPAL